MLKTGAAMGVCAACKYDPDCIYEAISAGTILQCEQFEMGFLERPAPTAQVRTWTETARHTNGYAGLCWNCEHRETCIYPKPEGGVWRCEEYA